MKNRRLQFGILLPLLTILASLSQAAPGDLDPTFGSGRLRVGAGGGTDYANGIARQSDGKIVIAGVVYDQMRQPDGNGSALVARYTANGTLDTTFGTNGWVEARVGTASNARAVAILPNGKILLAGATRNASNNIDFALFQYNTDGTPDAAFGSNGIVSTDFGSGSSDAAYTVVVQTDGKIVAAGTSDNRYALARYTSAGQPDPTFNGTGRVVGPTVANTYVQANAVTFVGTRIYFAGTKLAGSYSGFLTSLNSNGSLNTAFNGTGSVTLSGSGNTEANAITILGAIAGEEKILVAGSQETQTVWSYDANNGSIDTSFGGGTGRASAPLSLGLGTSIKIQTVTGAPSRILLAGAVNYDFLITRFQLDGTLDTAFGAGKGYVWADIGGDDYATGLFIQPSDNKLVVVGSTKQTANGLDLGGDDDVALARLNSNGTFDTTFGVGGKRVSDFGNAVVSADALVLQPDGKIIAAGGKLIARFNPDGSFDSSFHGDGKTKVPGGQIVRAALQTNGKIVLAATTTTTPPSGYFILYRLNTDGTPDATFSGDGFATISYANHTVDVSGLAIQANGAIVVGATSFPTNGAPYSLYSAARFLPDGTPDSTYGTTGTGIVGYVLVNTETCNALALQPDGKIVLAGTGLPTQDHLYHEEFIRLLTTGALDTNFNGGGNFAGPSGATVHALAIQSDGKIVAAGATGTAQIDFLASRVNTDGTDDSTFDGDGSAVTPISLFNDIADGIAIQSDGKILLAGVTNRNSGGALFDVALARYNVDGSLDSGYGNAGQVILQSTYGTDAAHDVAIDSQGRAVLAGESGGVFLLARLQAGGGGVPTIVSAVSRKTHGASGMYDINLPLTGTPGLECRSGASYQVVVTFSGAVTMSGFTVSGGASPDSFTVNGSTATLNLTPASGGGKRLIITMQNVTVGSTSGNIEIPMNLLVGDTNGNGTVNGTDVSQVKSQSGAAVTSSNFRSDVNASGTINTSDISQVKVASGSSLPAANLTSENVKTTR